MRTVDLYSNSLLSLVPCLGAVLERYRGWWAVVTDADAFGCNDSLSPIGSHLFLCVKKVNPTIDQSMNQSIEILSQVTVRFFTTSYSGEAYEFSLGKEKNGALLLLVDALADTVTVTKVSHTSREKGERERKMMLRL